MSTDGWGIMDDAKAEKIARNNSSFRVANEGIESSVIEHDLDPGVPIPFICECSDTRCTEIIRVTLEEYARVRANSRWFAHAVGHEEAVDGAVRTVERNQRFVLVEKIEHAGEVADSLAGERHEA
jgi:hypothetical protein